MKAIILVISILSLNIVSCQNRKKEELIEKFIVDLFDDKIPASKIVEEYIEIQADNNNSFSLLERKKMVEGVIEETRKGSDSKWLIPDSSIKNIKKPKVFLYEIHEKKNELNIAGIEELKKNVYVLLDAKEEKIIQYFYLGEGKIISFSLFIKGNDKEASFFSY